MPIKSCKLCKVDAFGLPPTGCPLTCLKAFLSGRAYLHPASRGRQVRIRARIGDRDIFEYRGVVGVGDKFLMTSLYSRHEEREASYDAIIIGSGQEWRLDINHERAPSYWSMPVTLSIHRVREEYCQGDLSYFFTKNPNTSVCQEPT